MKKRLEFKYEITQHTALCMQTFLSNVISLDPYSETAKGYYDVYSLYFDTPHLKSFSEKINGQTRRRKVRIRSYSASRKDSLYLEWKEKEGDLGFKERKKINFIDYRRLMDAETEGINGSTLKLVDKTAQLFSVFRYKPVVSVKYKRKAFYFRQYPQVRINFDYDLKATFTTDLFSGKIHIPISNSVVFEIKFYEKLPKTILRLIPMFELRRVAYSKYCQALTVCDTVYGSNSLAFIS